MTMRSWFLLFGLLFCACANGGTSPDAGDGYADGDPGTDRADPGDSGAEDGDGGDDGGDSASCGTQRVRQDIAIPTIDGYQLSAFLDRPEQSDCPLPTILLQTPYNKENAWTTFFQDERHLRPPMLTKA